MRLWQTFQSFGQWAGEEHISQLALSVSFALVVAFLAVDVLQVDGAPGMSHGGHVYDSGRGRTFNQVNQQVSQQEVT